MLTRSGWEPRLLLPLLVHSLRLTTGWPLPRLLLTPRSWPFSAESSRHLVRDLLLSSAMWSAEVRDSPLLATCGIPSFPFLFFSVATKVEIASGEMQQRYAATFWSLGNLSTFGSLGNLSRSPTQKRRLWNSGYISLNDENILLSSTAVHYISFHQKYTENFGMNTILIEIFREGVLLLCVWYRKALHAQLQYRYPKVPVSSVSVRSRNTFVCHAPSWKQPQNPAYSEQSQEL